MAQAKWIFAVAALRLGCARADSWLGPQQNVTVISGSHPHIVFGKTDTAASCEAECKANSACVGWTWHATADKCKGTDQNPKQVHLCYHMKGGHVSPQECRGHVSGYLQSEPAYPVPTKRQLEWMAGKDPVVGGFSQFMHFGLPTFWVEGDKFDPNGTYHDCATNAKYCDSVSCGKYAPCLTPELFQPLDLDPEQWVLAAKQLGVQEICLTAQHEGGFALWPSAYTNYSVAASSWMDGKGDVLRKFADACNKHDIGICYYLHPSCDHYSTMVEKVSAEDFSTRQLGKMREVLTKYGPVSRLWFDGKGKGPTNRYPQGLNIKAHVQKVINLIRSESPGTLITGYREFGGDIANSYQSLYLYDKGPEPNTTSVDTVGKPSETGSRFYPLEQVGICMQEGLSGNEDVYPTFWFEHPLIGHANNSRIYDGWLNLIGHGEVGMINVAPGRSGKMKPEYVQLMTEVGKAIRDSFSVPLAIVEDASAKCAASIELDTKGVAFDYIETKEDLTKSQRIRQYVVEYQRTGSKSWDVIVSPVRPKGLGDRPAGKDPRDSHVGFRRIDVPEVSTQGISKIRFRSLKCTGNTVYLRSLAVYKKRLPWEQSSPLEVVV